MPEEQPSLEEQVLNSLSPEEQQAVQAQPELLQQMIQQAQQIHGGQQ